MAEDIPDQNKNSSPPQVEGLTTKDLENYDELKNGEEKN